MSHSYRLILFCGFFLLIFSCSRKSSRPVTTDSAPRDTSDIFAPETEDVTSPPRVRKSTILPNMSSINTISEVQLPILIDSAALIKQVNKLIPQILYEDRDLTDDKMIVVAEKIDSVNLSIHPNKILYDVPFKLHIERDIGISTIKADGTLRLYFNTDYSIQENWAFETKTTILKHEWLEKPKVKVGFLNIPIESIANRIMLRSSDMVCKSIDEQLQEGFKLRDYVDQIWRKVQQPLMVTDTPVISWLLIQPKKIMMTPLKTIEGVVQTGFIFRSATDMVFGAKPELPYAGILPTFEQIETKSKDTLLSISIRFPLERAEVLLSDFFYGQEFREGTKVMMIDSIHLSGHEDKLDVDAYITGSYPAVLQFSGAPLYNRLKRRFELKDMQYKLKSKNVLVKAASWILKKNIDKKMSELLVYEMGTYFDEGKKSVLSALTQVSAAGFKIKPEIDDIWALDPVIIGKDAEIKFLSNGRFKIMVEDLVK